MKKNFIDRFFAELDRELGESAEIILTGAAAGLLMGHIRPSVDIDFEIRLRNRKKRREMPLIQEAIRNVSSKTGIAANYSEDIGRGSRIDYLDYRKSAVPYKTIGKLDLKVMAPEYWTIGKMTRFLEIDIRDLLKVVEKKKLKDDQLIRLWAKALRSSPLSSASAHFRDHVIYFLRHYGTSIWGKQFKPAEAIDLFKRSASTNLRGS